MKYLFYLGHPAHFHLFKYTIADLMRHHDVLILCKKKDVLENLLKNSGWRYVNILPEGRKNGRAAVIMGLIKRDLRMLQVCREYKPDLLIGTSPEITHIGAVLHIPSVVVNEDDFDVVPLFSLMAYPLASAILSPSPCKLGRWESKAAKYPGYQKLAYLHPSRFDPDPSKVSSLFGDKQRFYLIRLVSLNAHHDAGIKGISDELAIRLVRRLEQSGQVWISSERELNPELALYRLVLDPSDIHHALYFADLLVSDSQSMSVEAAMLGTPSIRVSDFVGKISVLEELEHRHCLTLGVHPNNESKLFSLLDRLLIQTALKVEWKKRRTQMINESIDVTSYFVWFIRNYPQGFYEVQKNPGRVRELN
jgi:predicted glycosyltransferase